MESKEASVVHMTITYGGEQEKLFLREWKPGEKAPYRKTYSLKPGQHWSDAEETPKQIEGYVLTPDGNQIPVGARIAQVLMAEGAEAAAFVELWGKCVLVNHELICIPEEGELGEVLAKIRAENHGKLDGLPDVIAVFPNGKVAFREAKRSGKDRIRPNQHQMAKLLRELFGTRLDLGVVEWDA